VTKQTTLHTVSVVTYALAAFRYLATGILAGACFFGAASVHLSSSLGQAIGAVPEQDYPNPLPLPSIIVVQSRPEPRMLKRLFFWRAGV